MSSDSSTPDLQDLGLRALRLRPGMFLQAQRIGGSADGSVVEATFCAAIDGKGLMVVPLGDRHEALADGQRLRVRGFTGLYDFGFDTQALQSFTHPFAYTLLAWPPRVTARRVRNAMRIRTTLPATVRIGPRVEEAVLVDLSPAGAMLRSARPLAAVGDHARLAFEITVDERPVALDLAAVACHANPCDSGDGFRSGWSFIDVARTDRLALQCHTLAALDRQDT